MKDVRLVVNIEDEILQTGNGGRKAVTEAMLTSTGGGSGATVATVDNIVMKDTDGTLFFKRVSSDPSPVITNWRLSDGSSYTITGTPVPYTVSTTNIEGSVEITNDTGNPIPISVYNVTPTQYNGTITGTQYAIPTNTVVHGESTAGGGSYVGLKVAPSGSLQVGGALDVSYGAGNSDTTTQRVVIASNQAAIAVSGTFYPATQPVSIASWGGLTDTQLRATAVPVSLSSLPALASGINTIGAISNSSFAISGTLPAFATIPAVKIDQTTDGTTNLVSAKQNGTWNIGSITALPALVSGSALIGKVGLDQTTQGTTNAVVNKGRYQASRPTLTDGTFSEYQLDSDGSLIVNIADSSALGAITDSQATDATSSWSLIALAKGLFTKLVSLVSLQTVTQTATQSVAVGASSIQSSAVGSTTTRISLTTTGNCWVSIGSNPTAAAHGANSFYLAAGSSSWLMNVTASTSKIAVIQEGSATGYLSILESV